MTTTLTKQEIEGFQEQLDHMLLRILDAPESRVRTGVDKALTEANDWFEDLKGEV